MTCIVRSVIKGASYRERVSVVSKGGAGMKKVSYVLAVVGVLLFAYAVIGRFIGESSVFGYIYALEAKTVVLGANTILLMAVLAWLYAKNGKGNQE